MSSKDLISEIAEKHGIAVGPDDPILVLHTLNQKLLEESQQHQHSMLNEFKIEIAAQVDRVQSESESRAERVLTAALNASQQLMEDGAVSAGKAVNKEIHATVGAFHEVSNRSRNIAIVNLVAACITLAAVLLLVVEWI